MLLSTLTEELTAHLNTSPQKWNAEGILAKSELDPSLCLLPGLGVYLSPGFIQFNLEGAGGSLRRAAVSINNTLYCTLIVSKVFVDLPSETGVANWDESKVIIDVRQRAEFFLIKYGFATLTLVSVDSQPLEEVQLDNRNFVSLTTYGYQQQSCVSQYELS